MYTTDLIEIEFTEISNFFSINKPGCKGYYNKAGEF